MNTDANLAKWLIETFGVGGIYAKPNSPSIAKFDWNQQYVWHVTAGPAVAILAGCLDYFIIKRAQAEIAIEFQKTKGLYRSKGRLALRIPENVIQFREELRQKLMSLHGKSVRGKVA